MIKPENGFAYLARRSLSFHFKDIENSNFELKVFEPCGDEEYKGVRMIDNALCNIWYSMQEKLYIGQRRY